ILKFVIGLVVLCLLYSNAFAQAEPQKSPLLGSTPPLPGVQKPSKQPADQTPPIAEAPDKAASDAARPNVEKNPPALNLMDMDTSVKPQDDFFRYANGGWIKRTEIPPEFARWGSFNELIEKNNDALHEITEKAAKSQADPKTVPELQKVGDYYGSGMDEKTIEAAGAKPLADELKRIDAIKNRNDVLKEIAHLHTLGIG